MKILQLVNAANYFHLLLIEQSKKRFGKKKITDSYFLKLNKIAVQYFHSKTSLNCAFFLQDVVCV